MKITRLYVDNYRCLQDFEFFPKQTNLLMGVNGSGKSSVREVLCKLCQVMKGDDVEAIFKQEHLTKWKDDEKQSFQLDLEINNQAYKYSLEIVHNVQRNYCKVGTESLTCDEEFLLKSDGNNTHSFKGVGDGDGMTDLVTNSRGSALSGLPTDIISNRLDQFREALLNLAVVSINPVGMSALSGLESAHPSEYFENYLDWLRLNSSQYQEEYMELTQTLTQVLPDFRAFQFDPAGEGVKECYLKFSNSKSGSYRIRFDRISDGQRVLVILYSLLAFAEYHPILFLDEPQNFVSIQEIQPWMFEALDRFEDVDGQLFLSSHNTELINLLVPEYGVWIERDSSGKSVIKNVNFAASTLLPAEQIARGWIDE